MSSAVWKVRVQCRSKRRDKAANLTRCNVSGVLGQQQGLNAGCAGWSLLRARVTSCMPAIQSQCLPPSCSGQQPNRDSLHTCMHQQSIARCRSSIEHPVGNAGDASDVCMPDDAPAIGTCFLPHRGCAASADVSFRGPATRTLWIPALLELIIRHTYHRASISTPARQCCALPPGLAQQKSVRPCPSRRRTWASVRGPTTCQASPASSSSGAVCQHVMLCPCNRSALRTCEGTATHP